MAHARTSRARASASVPSWHIRALSEPRRAALRCLGDANLSSTLLFSPEVSIARAHVGPLSSFMRRVGSSPRRAFRGPGASRRIPKPFAPPPPLCLRPKRPFPTSPPPVPSVRVGWTRTFCDPSLPSSPADHPLSCPPERRANSQVSSQISRHERRRRRRRAARSGLSFVALLPDPPLPLLISRVKPERIVGRFETPRALPLPSRRSKRPLLRGWGFGGLSSRRYATTTCRSCGHGGRTRSPPLGRLSSPYSGESHTFVVFFASFPRGRYLGSSSSHERTASGLCGALQL